jgi:3'(2'), 5'-bisphosphate nucleotidase
LQVEKCRASWPFTIRRPAAYSRGVPHITLSELDALGVVAQAAGLEIMDVYGRGDAQSWTKADDSPLTQADLRADAAIEKGLQQAFPGIPIWSEEGQARTAATSPSEFFLVDPLDGTKEFLKRNGEFTVNIAWVRDGRPVAGVVLAPSLGQLYCASAGVGAWRRSAEGEAPLRARGPVPGEPLRVIGSRSHGGDLLDTWLGQLQCDHTFLPAGSSLKFCRIAEGLAHVYPRMGPTSQWDTAAAQAVLEAAGGAVLDAQGRELAYGFDRPVLNPYFIALARRDMVVPAIG